MKIPMVLAGILILAMAGFCLAQTAAPVPPTSVKVKADAQKAPMAAQVMKGNYAKYLLVKLDDGLQCLLKHKSEMAAAYTEAANAGCTKKKVGQGTLYDCGYYNSAEAAKCNAAAAKIQAIIKNCGLKPPVFHDPDPNDPEDIFGDETPGCNSLGIACMVIPG